MLLYVIETCIDIYIYLQFLKFYYISLSFCFLLNPIECKLWVCIWIRRITCVISLPSDLVPSAYDMSPYVIWKEIL